MLLTRFKLQITFDSHFCQEEDELTADDAGDELEDIEDDDQEIDSPDHSTMFVEQEDASDAEYYSASEDAILNEQETQDVDLAEIETFDENIVFPSGPVEGGERRRRHSSKRKAKWHRQERRVEKGLPFCNEADMGADDVIQQLAG